MIHVYVGTEDSQLIPQLVLEYSIRKNSAHDIVVVPVKQNTNRIGGTNFGFVRFMVPSLQGFVGTAIYLDADQLVFCDIAELLRELPEAYSIALVNNPIGFFGEKEVPKHNQTSVMVMDCSKLMDWDPQTMFAKVIPNRGPLGAGEIHYRDFMMLTWFDQSKIWPISPAWNHFNIVESETRIVHFSHVRSQPWKKPNHPLSTMWGEWLGEAVRNRAVGRFVLVREILKGNVDKHFLRCLLPWG